MIREQKRDYVENRMKMKPETVVILNIIAEQIGRGVSPNDLIFRQIRAGGPKSPIIEEYVTFRRPVFMLGEDIKEDFWQKQIAVLQERFRRSVAFLASPYTGFDVRRYPPLIAHAQRCFATGMRIAEIVGGGIEILLPEEVALSPLSADYNISTREGFPIRGHLWIPPLPNEIFDENGKGSFRICLCPLNGREHEAKISIYDYGAKLEI